MSNISAWSTTAASNNSSPPDGFPENQLPSTVNNSARELMAAIRTFYEGAAWIDLGDTPTYATTTTFTVPGDKTAYYTANRRIRCTDATTLYGYISGSVYVSSTTVTVVLDSGSLSASLTAVAVGLLDPTHYPVAAEGIKGTLGNTSIGGTLDVTGITTVNGQIAFPSTQNASSDVNTLDDYKEGTWTPSLGGTATYSSQDGHYTKIGKLVFFDFALTVGSIGTGSTHIISGLPYSPANSYHAQIPIYWQFANTSVVNVIGNVVGTTIELYGATAAAVTQSILTGFITTSTVLYGSGCYIASS